MHFWESNSKLILDHLSTQIYLIDQEYNVIACNQEFTTNFGQSQQDILGRKCYEVTHNIDFPCWQLEDTLCPAKEAFQKKKRIQTVHHHSVGDKIVVEEVTATPINNGQYVIEEFRNLSKLLGLVHGTLPICAGCKKIRDDQGEWHEVEGYLHDKTGADFSHSICPECAIKFYPEFTQKKKNT